MRFPWRGAAPAAEAAGGQARWPGPPQLAERSCCPARPVVALISPASAYRHPVDLL